MWQNVTKSSKSDRSSDDDRSDLSKLTFSFLLFHSLYELRFLWHMCDSAPISLFWDFSVWHMTSIWILCINFALFRFSVWHMTFWDQILYTWPQFRFFGFISDSSHLSKWQLSIWPNFTESPIWSVHLTSHMSRLTFFDQFCQSAHTTIMIHWRETFHSSFPPFSSTVLSGVLFKNPSHSIVSRDPDPRVKGVCGGDYP